MNIFIIFFSLHHSCFIVYLLFILAWFEIFCATNTFNNNSHTKLDTDRCVGRYVTTRVVPFSGCEVRLDESHAHTRGQYTYIYICACIQLERRSARRRHYNRCRLERNRASEGRL